MTLTELKAKLDQLSPVKIRFVANVVDSLSNPPRASIFERGTWITGVPEWIEYFGLAVSVHHGTTTEPLGLTAFETVFRNACKSVNWTLDPPGICNTALRRSGSPGGQWSKETAFPEIDRREGYIENQGTHLQVDGSCMDTG